MRHLRVQILLFTVLTLFITSPTLAAESDVVKINAINSATETVESLKKLITEKRFKIFSAYDHGNAKSVKQLVAFGKADQNARIMWHDPAASLELPLKIAVLQDDVGTRVFYRKPTSLRNTYSVEDCRLLDDMDEVMAELAQKAAQ